jgi:hypothetical protein
MRTLPLVCSSLLALAAAGARAQEAGTRPPPRSVPGRSLDRTMHAFLADLEDARGYFPTRGEWTWVLAAQRADGGWTRGIQRFPAAQTDSAMAPGGPVCDAFHSGDFVAGGTLIGIGMDHAGPWRRVGPRRFAAPGQPAVFVEWRREDGRWVVSSFGGVRAYVPPVIPPPDEAMAAPDRGEPLHLPLPTDGHYAASEEWYHRLEPIVVAGTRLTANGPGGRLVPEDAAQLVLWGTYRGVPVYVEKTSPPNDRRPSVIYLAVDAEGTFQPYANMSGNGCEH